MRQAAGGIPLGGIAAVIIDNTTNNGTTVAWLRDWRDPNPCSQTEDEREGQGGRGAAVTARNSL